jgi:hypothetical protein
MTKKFLLLACASTFFAAINCFSQGVAFDSLKANTGTNKTLIFTPVANYGHKIYGFDASTKTDMRFAVRANTPTWTDIMAITSTGYVGIGTNDPVAKLSVYGLTANDGTITIQSASDSRFYIQEGSNTLKIGGIISGTGVINVINNGKVGIGDSGPVSKLSIYSATNNDGISLQTASDHRFYISEGDDMLKIGGLVSETGAINITNTGNVGIGTLITGTNKLAVEGTIAARRVRVTQATAWPDFVFDSSYQLPSLQEIKNYVTVNKHLPDVPSAKEVEKNGQDLGEMNRVLLQKVEELTLHLIELEEKLDKLEKSKK